MNADKITFLTQLWDLCDTIGQGTDYLSSHCDDEQMMLDIKAALNALSQHFAGDTNVLTLLNQLQNLLSPFPLNNDAQDKFLSALISTKNHLLDEISASISNSLTNELRDVSYIDRSTAESIFQFWNNAPHRNISIFQLMFEVCSKCSYSAPKEAFEYTVQLFEEQPGILASQGSPHPDYVYQRAPQRTFERCPICGGTGIPHYRAFTFELTSFSNPHLPVKLWMKCDTCGNLYTWKHPEEHLELSSHSELILPNQTEHLATIGNSNGTVLALWADILKKLQTYTKGTKLLEVGVGNGDLLSVALELEYDADAVEIVPGAAKRTANLLNIPVWNGDFLKYETDQKYDIIIMGDVIEHMTDPGFALEKVKKLLNPGGVLWLSTPNYESAYARIHKSKDAMWRVCNHLTYFSRKGFKVLAEQNGFEILEYEVSKRYNGSMELVMRVPS